MSPFCTYITVFTIVLFLGFGQTIARGHLRRTQGSHGYGHGHGHGHGNGNRHGHEHGHGHGNGQSHRRSSHRNGHGRRSSCSGQKQPKLFSDYSTIVVDHSGRGNFTTIQSAIESVPSNNQNWICIYIKAGTYNEQVKIPMDKPMIYLQGEGRSSTNVVYGGDDILSGVTFFSGADNIVAKDISFTNSYNYPPGSNGNTIKPASAALINGDKSAFYDCGFFGFQDTLWDNSGRHYFKDCIIEGAVDFIMGSGQSIYEGSTISVITKTLGVAGFITAQSRGSPNESSGFVFRDCYVVGDGPALLGRPWRSYARVLFYHCSLSNIIAPEGWSAWDTAGHEHQLTFAEERCNGLGSDTSRRVEWESKLSRQMVRLLTSMSFIDREGWISRQPYHMSA